MAARRSPAAHSRKTAVPAAGNETASPGWHAIAAVFAGALVIRAIYLWQLSDAPFFNMRLGDGEAYHAWAKRIAAGDWLGSDVFYQAPLYPYLLAAVYRIFGDGAGTVRVVQAVLGGGSCALLAACGTSLFGRWGVLAGWGLAIYPPALFLDSQIDKSALATFLIALFLLAQLRQSWLAAGAVLGLLALTRENSLLLTVPVLVGIGAGPRQKRARAALLFAAGISCVLLPNALRNLAAGGEFHLTTAQFGPNLYIGNHPGASGTYEPLVRGHGNAADERVDATRIAEQAAGRKLAPREVSGYWTSRALAYATAQPLDWLRLTARKIVLALNSTEASDTESQSVYAEWSWLLRILRPLDFALVLALAIFGSVLMASDWRRLWVLWALAMVYVLSVVAFYVLARYRAPLVPILLLLAAGGVTALPGIWRKGSVRSIVIASGAAVLGLAFAHLPAEDPRAARAAHYFAIGAGLAIDPERLALAAAFYRHALEADPRFPAAHLALGAVLARGENAKEAIAHYRAALSVWPDYEEARFNLGAALAAAGLPEEALREYNEALRLRPDDIEARIALAKTLIVLNRPEAALEQYRLSLAAQPQNGSALVGLGVALAQLGRPEDAIQQFQRALALNPQDAAAHNGLGSTLANRGLIEEALHHFERALALNPDDEAARRNVESARTLLSKRRQR